MTDAWKQARRHAGRAGCYCPICRPRPSDGPCYRRLARARARRETACEVEEGYRAYVDQRIEDANQCPGGAWNRCSGPWCWCDDINSNNEASP